MPRDGATLLSDVRRPGLTVVCEPCGGRERCDVERLIRQYGWDAKLTDLLATLASFFDRCKAVYERGNLTEAFKGISGGCTDLLSSRGKYTLIPDRNRSTGLAR